MIKRLDKEDIPECVNVIKASFLTVAEGLGFTKENAPGFTAFSISNERLTEQYKDSQRLMYAYYDKDKIVGYYSLLLQENDECELNNLSVLPEYRHQGIGEKLVRHAFDNAGESHCKKIDIGIVEENVILKQWYEKLGFVHIGTKKFDFFPFTCGYMEKQIIEENAYKTERRKS